MEKLKKEYKEKYEVISSRADKIWKIGMIILTILLTIIYFIVDTIVYKIFLFVVFYVLVGSLFKICSYIYDKELYKQIQIIYGDKNLIDRYNVEYFEELLNEYQKRCITEYIRKNKLNKLGKLSIVINELQDEINKSPEKILRESITISGVLGIFTSFLNFDIQNSLIVYILQYLMCIMSCLYFLLGLRKLYDCKTFSKYIGLERLKELLIHAALKHGR